MVTKQNTLLARYRYDALDRMTIQASTNKADSHRFYCQGRLSTEVSGAQRCSIVQYGDHLLVQQNQESGVSESMLMATQNDRSVLAGVEASNCIAFAYSPFGHRVNNPLNSLLGFNGERPDPVTGHYLLGNGYRAFNPILMRFNSPDSLSPFGDGGLNCYAYCLGDPVNKVDPTGHSSLYRMLSLASEYIGRGVKTQFYKNHTKITDGVITFELTTRKGRKLMVWGHGAPGLIGNENETFDARQLNKLLEKNDIFAGNFDRVQIAACYSADAAGQSGSLAESFSRIVGRPVKGYHGVMAWSAKPEKVVDNKTVEFAIIKDRSALSRALLKDINAQYRPETFYPESKVALIAASSIRQGSGQL